MFSLPSPSCLPSALPSPHYFTILLSLSSVLELGRRLRCREQTAQVSRCFSLFLFPSVFTSYPTCNTSFFILCYRPSFPPPPNPGKRPSSSCFARVQMRLPFLYDLPSPASTSSNLLSSSPGFYVCRFATATLLASHIGTCTPAPPVTASCSLFLLPLQCPIIIPVYCVCVSWIFRFARAHAYACLPSV